MADRKAELLLKCPVECVSKFLHGVLDGICQLQPCCKYQDFSEVWSLEDWWDVTDWYTHLFKEAVKNSWGKEKLNQSIEALSVNYQQHVLDALSARRQDARRSLVHDTCAISHSQLHDFDWQLKLALASDKIASLQEPLVSFDLDLQQQQGSKMVSVELNKNDLEKMIAALEAANKAVIQVKT